MGLQTEKTDLFRNKIIQETQLVSCFNPFQYHGGALRSPDPPGSYMALGGPPGDPI